jgi:hypothetical protein
VCGKFGLCRETFVVKNRKIHDEKFKFTHLELRMIHFEKQFCVFFLISKHTEQQQKTRFETTIAAKDEEMKKMKENAEKDMKKLTKKFVCVVNWEKNVSLCVRFE